MRKFTGLILIALLLSCGKNKGSSDAVQEVGYIMAKSNGIDWKGKVYAKNVNDSLYITGIRNQPNDEVLVIKIKFEGAGVYSLSQGQVQYYETVGGDAIVNQYGFEMGATGTLTISKYQKETKSIEGQFSANLVKKMGGTSYPKIRSFEKGVIEAVISTKN